MGAAGGFRDAQARHSSKRIDDDPANDDDAYDEFGRLGRDCATGRGILIVFALHGTVIVTCFANSRKKKKFRAKVVVGSIVAGAEVGYTVMLSLLCKVFYLRARLPASMGREGGMHIRGPPLTYTTLLPL